MDAAFIEWIGELFTDSFALLRLLGNGFNWLIIVIMAILGGALIPLFQAGLVDVANVNYSYAVPMVCFLVIACFALFSHRIPASEPTT